MNDFVGDVSDWSFDDNTGTLDPPGVGVVAGDLVFSFDRNINTLLTWSTVDPGGVDFNTFPPWTTPTSGHSP